MASLNKIFRRRSRRIGKGGALHFIPTTKKHERDAEFNKQRAKEILVAVPIKELEELGYGADRWDYRFASEPKGRIYIPGKDGKLERSTEEAAVAHFAFLERTRTHYFAERMVKGKPYKYKRKLDSPLFEPARVTLVPWLLEYWRDAQLSESDILEKLEGLVESGAELIRKKTGREVVGGTIHLDSGIPHIEWLTTRCADMSLESGLVGKKNLGLCSEWLVDDLMLEQIGVPFERKKAEYFQRAKDRLAKDYPDALNPAVRGAEKPLDLALKLKMMSALIPPPSSPSRPAFDAAKKKYVEWKTGEHAAKVAAAEKRLKGGNKLAVDAVRGLLQVALGQRELGAILTKFAIEQVVELIIEKSPVVAEWFASTSGGKKVSGGRNMGMEMGV